MSSSTEAQRLIALSLGKIAMSRQQKGGINLHKNLLVASVLHKARTTYMMDNFQTLLANKRAQAEKEAAAKMIVDRPVENSSDNTSMEVSVQSRGVTDSCTKSNTVEAPHGVRVEKCSNTLVDKENMSPVSENSDNKTENTPCDKSVDLEKKSCTKELPISTPIVSGKVPLSEHRSRNYVSQSASCRCAGGKRRRSFVTEYESVTEPKRPRFEEDSENSDSESEYESDSCDSVERMQTESTQVTNLVDIFNTGFNGLCKDTHSGQSTTGHINVYVSADRSVSGHQYVLTDISCGTQIKDSVAIPTAIALAV